MCVQSVERSERTVEGAHTMVLEEERELELFYQPEDQQEILLREGQPLDSRIQCVKVINLGLRKTDKNPI